ncbi:uncharacterized protein [Narcine bancroftii]|uniref:uncharacterized protein isoform X2 n=1 Tax=Narcine bancroftii TaxID=1343680 RepID=UPI0038320EE0
MAVHAGARRCGWEAGRPYVPIMCTFLWAALSLLQVSTADLDFIQVLNILVAGESGNESLGADVLLLNGTGLLRARVGDPLSLYCRILLLSQPDGERGARYQARWEVSRSGQPVTVASCTDQDGPSGPWVDPGYADRVGLLSCGPDHHLRFVRLEEADFGEYVCRGLMVDEEGEAFSILSVLALDSNPDEVSLPPVGSDPTSAPRISSIAPSGRVWGWLGAAVQLECRAVPEGAIPRTQIAWQWERVLPGTGNHTLTLARHEVGSLDLLPGKVQRMALHSQGLVSRLQLRNLQREDFGEYRCKTWVSRHPEDTVQGSVVLEEGQGGSIELDQNMSKCLCQTVFGFK